jgi:T-complex protein 1 subunit eta
LDLELEYKHQGEHTKIAVTSSEELKEFVKVEWDMFENQLNKIERTGCNVILNRKAVGDFATQFFAKKNIASIGRIDVKTMQLLSKAMNVRVISSVEHLSTDDEKPKLGKCVLYEEKKIGEDYYSVLNTKKSPVVTIILHGASNMLVEEVERSFIDAFSAIKRLHSHQSIVLGGGATEMQLRQRLKAAAGTENKNIKKVFEAFGDALSEIPAAICDNAGLDTANIMIDLEKIHASDNKNGYKYGIGVNEKKPMDMHDLYVWEPSAIKRTALQAAVEASTLILSINGVIALPREESLADKNVRIAEQNQGQKYSTRRQY